jgi:hypothetical protein
MNIDRPHSGPEADPTALAAAGEFFYLDLGFGHDVSGRERRPSSHSARADG